MTTHLKTISKQARSTNMEMDSMHIYCHNEPHILHKVRNTNPLQVYLRRKYMFIFNCYVEWK
jgi:hypothetical protein